MPEIAVIADRMSAEVFSLTDFEVMVVSEQESAESLLEKAVQKQLAIIFITENVLAGQDGLAEKFKAAAGSVLVVIPGIGPAGNGSFGVQPAG